MLKISELREYAEAFAGGSISEFIDFIEAAQAKMKNSGVITLEQRETARKLKEMTEARREQKPFDPDEDMDNL